MKETQRDSYAVFAAVVMVISLLVAGGTALAREAESGGGSSSGSSSSGSGLDDSVGGVDLRGDGTIDDNLPRQSGLDDVVNGVKLRGDGTVDDNLPRRSGLDDSIGGVDLRGDGTIDDNLPRRSGLDSARDLQERGIFSNDLRVGMRNDDVIRLQHELEFEGLFSNSATGFFGEATREAVIKFQRERGLPETGLVGPMTRAELNRSNASASLDSSGPSSSSGPGDDSRNESRRGEGEVESSRSFLATIGGGIRSFFSRMGSIFGL